MSSMQEPEPRSKREDRFRAHEELELRELATFASNAGIESVPLPLREVVSATPKANPDDPPVQRPPQGPHGPEPAPYYVGLEGRISIVQGQVFILAVIVIAQLWLVTVALYELLSGRPDLLGYVALASFFGFIIAFIVTLLPRRRIERPSS